MTTAPAVRRPLAQGMELVRLALRVDAVPSGLNGLAYLALSVPLSDALGLSRPLLLALGAFFVVYAAALWALAAGREIPLGPVRLIAAGNALWCALSLAVVAAGVLDPTTAGAVWLVLQGLLVLGFAVLQAWALRRVA